MPRKALAAAASIHRNTLARLEGRPREAPLISTLARLAHALGVDHPGKLLIVEWTWWPYHPAYPRGHDRHLKSPPRPYPGYRPDKAEAWYYDPGLSRYVLDAGAPLEEWLLHIRQAGLADGLPHR